jgi:putative addiction module killer protein
VSEISIREILLPNGRSPFGRWFATLDARAAAKVSVALTRLELRNDSNTKSVGGGVSELKIDFGPGYRVYYGKDGEQLIILLGGGTKKRQDEDIQSAKVHWNNYKQRRKKQEI